MIFNLYLRMDIHLACHYTFHLHCSFFLFFLYIFSIVWRCMMRCEMNAKQRDETMMTIRKEMNRILLNDEVETKWMTKGFFFHFLLYAVVSAYMKCTWWIFLTLLLSILQHSVIPSFFPLLYQSKKHTHTHKNETDFNPNDVMCLQVKWEKRDEKF